MNVYTSARGKLICCTAAMLSSILVFEGCLARPRSVSSPPVTIRLVTEGAAPLSGVLVERSWDDLELHRQGFNSVRTGDDGVAEFPSVPGHVTLSTGVAVRTMGFFAACPPGRGTTTEIYVRYPTLCNVIPQDHRLQAAGKSRRDENGVWFETNDAQGKTIAALRFPDAVTSISYVLLSSPR
jgi:hypothetical protein